MTPHQATSETEGLPGAGAIGGLVSDTGTGTVYQSTVQGMGDRRGGDLTPLLPQWYPWTVPADRV